MMNAKDLLTISLAMYEGEDAAAAAAAAAAASDGDAQHKKAGSDIDPGKVTTTPRDGTDKVFTQEEVNKFLAEDRRKHQQRQQQLESALQAASNNQSLTQEERDAFKKQLEDSQKTFRSKEQQLEHERKEWEEKYKTDVEALKSTATTWEERFRTSTVERSLSEAAREDSFRPEQVVALLRPMTKIVEQTNEAGEPTGELVPMVDLQDIDTKTGEPIITRRTPEEAVKRMKELPELWGNLFKSNVVSGIGSGSATGSGLPGTGAVDPKRLSPEQYMKLRKENPKALGLA
jgi:hypothetical protein